MTMSDKSSSKSCNSYVGSSGGGGGRVLAKANDPNPDLWCSSYVLPEFSNHEDDYITRARCIAAALDPCMSTSPIPPPPPGGGGHVDAVRSLSNHRRKQLLLKYYPQGAADFILHSAISHNELVEALQRVPHLVMEETPLERFILLLRRQRRQEEDDDGGERTTEAPKTMTTTAGNNNNNNNNSNDNVDGDDDVDADSVALQQEALTQIILHWKIRMYFFGERAFLPMIMTHTSGGQQQQQQEKIEGALSEEDVEWLKLGVYAMLPRETDTVRGGLVFVSDRSRLPDHYTPACPSVPCSTRHDNILLRVSFYMLHLNTMLPSTTDGVGSLVVAAAQELRPPSPYVFNWNLIVNKSVCPLPARETRMMLLPSKQRRHSAQGTRKRRADSSSSSFLSAAINSTKRILEETSDYAFGALRFSFGYTDEHAARKLCAGKGLKLDCFPTWMGGNWDEGAFDQWIEQQMQMERKTVSVYSASMKRRATERGQPMSLEALRSKRKRERAKRWEQHLQQQLKQLKSQNDKLSHEHVRLKQLLECAQVEISILDGEDLELELIDDEDDLVLAVDDFWLR